MTTITIEEKLNLKHTHFRTIEDAYYAWLDSQDGISLRPLNPKEITPERQKDCEIVDKMNENDLVDIR